MIKIKNRLPIVALMATLMVYPFEDAVDASAFGSNSPWLERATQTAMPVIAQAAVTTADRPAAVSSSSRFPMAAAIGTACVALASGGLYCAYQWYTQNNYWNVETVTQGLQESLTGLNLITQSGVPEIVWDNASNSSLPTGRRVKRTHGEAELTVAYNDTDSKWHVQECLFKQATNPGQLDHPGRMQIKASYRTSHNPYAQAPICYTGGWNRPLDLSTTTQTIERYK